MVERLELTLLGNPEVRLAGQTAETDPIFAHLEQLRQQHQADKTVLRLSMDAKATVLKGLGKIFCAHSPLPFLWIVISLNTPNQQR